MDWQLRATLTETAYYKIPISVSVTGKETFGSAVSFLCRTEYNTVQHGPNFLPRAGEDSEPMHLLFTETNIPMNARIWIPGANTDNVALAYKVNRIEICRDMNGAVSHYEVYI